ncbi:MAG TPA: SPOR domain-containing protein [Gaiellaceae bacterium]|nr:SPOR domain-containing protein [Gaiellaceae bacterium]
MADDWRIRIDVEDVHERLLERLGVELDDEARELARELKDRRLAVSRDSDEVFVYASSRAEAESALKVVESELQTLGVAAKTSKVEHWLEAEERWDDEPKDETWEAEELDHGYAPWEVRVQASSRDEARTLAEQLEAEGYRPIRRFHYLIVGASSKEEAEALAKRLHGSVELGGEVVWEETPPNPFAIFGGLGG